MSIIHTKESDRRDREHREIGNLPANRRIKIAAIICISLCFLLLVIQLYWFFSLPRTAMLIIRGCTGLAAIAFAVLYAIWIYRINHTYIRRRHSGPNPGHRDSD
ncbi:MAG: hypothetical protein K2O78_00500 [Muribaculaceae bacterium]|nr:hypothetical protein [Muribaculaceae bacterium]